MPKKKLDKQWDKLPEYLAKHEAERTAKEVREWLNNIDWESYFKKVTK